MEKFDPPMRQLIRCLIREKVWRESGKQGVAVYLSGGVDSMTLGFCCQDLGFQVHGYVFVVDNKETSDSVAATRACKMFGWKLTKVNIPSANLYEDFKRLTAIGCRKKTHYECTWPMLYLFPATEEKFILGGYGADIHYGLSQKACMHHKGSLESLNEYRFARFADDNPNGVRQRELLARAREHVLVEPYMESIMLDFMRQFTWEDCNHPVEKAVVLRCFPEFHKFGRRGHANYQLVAKIPELFEKLLDTDLNFKNRRRVMDLCRDHYERRQDDLR